MACSGSHPATRMIYTGPAQPRNPLDKPPLAFDQIFGGITQAEADAHRKRSVLDAVVRAQAQGQKVGAAVDPANPRIAFVADNETACFD